MSDVDRILQDITESHEIVRIFRDIADAHMKAIEKHGPGFNTWHGWVGILGEEFGEFSKATNEFVWKNESTSSTQINLLRRMREEAIDVSQTSLSIIRQIDVEIKRIGGQKE